MRFLGLFFWPVWMRLGLNVNRLWFKHFYEAPSILAAILSFGVLHTKPSRRISEKD
jgi:hypothetical protein